jgi:DNA-binding transcriptional regulator GbsR (MarR family)
VNIDDYVIEVLMRDLVGHDRSPSAYLVYLYLSGRRGGPVAMSYQQIADATGLSKSAAQAGVRVLRRRRLVKATKTAPTATPEYTVLRPWDRSRS